MKKEQIIELIKREMENSRAVYLEHINQRNEAMHSGKLEIANRYEEYRKSEIAVFVTLEYIYNKIKD